MTTCLCQLHLLLNDDDIPTFPPLSIFSLCCGRGGGGATASATWQHRTHPNFPLIFNQKKILPQMTNCWPAKNNKVRRWRTLMSRAPGVFESFHLSTLGAGGAPGVCKWLRRKSGRKRNKTGQNQRRIPMTFHFKCNKFKFFKLIF